jgi:hypothetical protein
VCRSFSFFFQKRTRLKDYKKNVRKQINGKFYSLKFKIYPHLFSTEPKKGEKAQNGKVGADRCVRPECHNTAVFRHASAWALSLLGISAFLPLVRQK